ncbi:tetratricopeptide repeat protein [Hyphobacterium sp.]|jgi:tetratricopeptide (TPR) repeat protein|uniref:tetratricopeptide repeat protein n=1 Tax=Hyphobacterium sp. TaxID=2004662 RepID=UPI003BA92B00
MKALLLALALQVTVPVTGPEFQTPEERLEERLDALQTATPDAAPPLVDEILALWATSGSDTIDLLMDRGETAMAAENPDIAARMFNHVTQLQPDYAEGWLRSAQVAFAQQDWSYALEALNETLALEPRRFDAYFLLGSTLERADQPQAALEAYQEALAIYPTYELAGRAAARIRAELRGRSL